MYYGELCRCVYLQKLSYTRNGSTLILYVKSVEPGLKIHHISSFDVRLQFNVGKFYNLLLYADRFGSLQASLSGAF